MRNYRRGKGIYTWVQYGHGRGPPSLAHPALILRLRVYACEPQEKRKRKATEIAMK